MEQATTERIQRMIDAEATERFGPDAVRRLMLLRHGDHPVIEPGELYLLVILGQDGVTRDAWMAEQFDRLADFRARRLPEVKGFVLTTEARESAGRPPTRIMRMDGISLLDPEEDEIARGLIHVPEALLGPVDLATLDTLASPGRGQAWTGPCWTSCKPGSVGRCGNISPTAGCSGSRCCNMATTRRSSLENCWPGHSSRRPRKTRPIRPGTGTTRR